MTEGLTPVARSELPTPGRPAPPHGRPLGSTPHPALPPAPPGAAAPPHRGSRLDAAPALARLPDVACTRLDAARLSSRTHRAPSSANSRHCAAGSAADAVSIAVSGAAASSTTSTAATASPAATAAAAATTSGSVQAPLPAGMGGPRHVTVAGRSVSSRRRPASHAAPSVPPSQRSGSGSGSGAGSGLGSGPTERSGSAPVGSCRAPRSGLARLGRARDAEASATASAEYETSLGGLVGTRCSSRGPGGGAEAGSGRGR